MMHRLASALGLLLALIVTSAAQAAPPTFTLQLDLAGHAGPLRRLDVSEARDLVVTSSDDYTARLWSLRDGRVIHVLRPPMPPGVLPRLYGAALHPGEPLVALGGTTGTDEGGHRIFLFDTDSGALLRTIDAHGGDVKRLAWSADGTLLLATYAGAHGLRAFDRGGTMVFEMSLGAPAYGIDVARDGVVAVTSMDGRVLIFSAAQSSVTLLGEVPANLGSPVSVAFSPDASRVVIGYNDPRTSPELRRVRDGALLGRLDASPVKVGNLMSVAWSRDGRSIFAGGNGADGDGRILLLRYDAGSQNLVSVREAAEAAVLDFRPLSDGRLVYSSFDGAWRIDDGDMALPRGSPVRFVWHRDGLSIASDGRAVRWEAGQQRSPMGFRFDKRLPEPGDNAQSAKPRERRGLFNAPDWDFTGMKTAQAWGPSHAKASGPVISGREVPLLPGEVTRAFSFVGDAAGSVLGTSQRLVRIAESGEVAWALPLSTEVRAVVATADGRMLVTAMSDGTVRWWRADDGSPLLALYVDAQGNWVSWTVNGFYDSSGGADQLVGWAVGFEADQALAFFRLNRFREQFRRPDLIDKVLETADLDAALQALDAARRQAVEQLGGDQAAPALPDRMSANALPPSLAALGPTRLKADAGEVVLPFVLRSTAAGLEVQIEIRIDGRRVDPLAISEPVLQAGQMRGSARLRLPAGANSVQVFARTASGVSEPLQFLVDRAVDAASARAYTDAGLPRGRTLYLLAVGISAYQKEAYRLGLPAKDARDFAAAMQAQQGGAYERVEVRVLTDEHARREDIRAGLRWLRESTGEHDVGVLFLAGHGVNDSKGIYHFVPYDGDIDRLGETAVAQGEIRGALAGLKGRAMLFVDTCFAANVAADLGAARRRTAGLASELTAAENSVIVFASSSGLQESEEKDEWGNGAFTKALVEALTGQVQRLRDLGQLSFDGLRRFVSDRVRSLTSGRQTPVAILPGGGSLGSLVTR